MRLTQLKLAGFKSFVDPTSIQVPSQLVGVVGPNGCGKSNIIDAVRWVLGESKASELRGESMQDVIFNGSGQRKPAARASVELIFDNGEGRASGQWGQYAEIAVKRVLTRDGTSSYFVNNQQVRRRDIHDIFLGTGLGAKGYAIIGQGMISRIIEARPEELRVFLEEAAGVSRYKERRRETENRLNDTRDNMTRVEDILQELESQLGKLEAQAAVAQRYHQFQHDLEQKQQFLWLLKKQEADTDRNKFAHETERAQTELESAMAGLRKLEADVEVTRQAHYRATDATHTAQAAVYESNAEVAKLEAEIRYVVDSRSRLQQQQIQSEQQLEHWKEQYASAETALAVAEENLAIGEAQAEDALVHAEAARESLPEQERSLREAGLAVAELRQKLSQLEQQIALTAQTQREADRQLQSLQLRLEKLDQEARAVERPDADVLTRVAGDLSETEARQQDAWTELEELESQLPVLDQARQAAQSGAQQEAAKLAQLEARLQALLKLQEDVQKQGALQPWLEKHDMAAFKRLWQQIQVEAGWETALESVLRERLASIELSQLDWVKAFFQDAPPARLAFHQLSASPEAPAAMPGFQPLSACLKGAQVPLQSMLTAWLQGVFVADDPVQALSARDQLPPGSCFVLKSGHQIDRHSVRFYAPDSEQSGMLARQQEIENLQRQIKAQQLISDEGRSASVRAEAAYHQLAQQLGQSRQRASELTQRVHALQLEYNKLAQQLAQADARSQRLEEERAELSAQQEEWRIRKEEAEMRFETLDVELGEQQMVFEEAQMAQEQREAQVQQARDKGRELERLAQEAGFAVRGLRAKIDEHRREMQLATTQTVRVSEDAERVRQDLASLDDEAAKAGLQDSLALRAEKEEALRLTRIEFDNLAAQLREAELHRMEIEKSLEPRRARIMELQLKEQAARLAQEQFAEQLEGVEVDVQALIRALEALPESSRKASWLQSEIQRLGREINALGAVNLAALDELNASRERKVYLDSQHQDLQSAIDTLEDAIRKIDRETRQLLQETFDAVNQNFGELFPSLFGGGEAKLVMTGDEILDAGVQVMAQPPGKRNSTIHLLSGGEKALTATALVFALFRLNPAPFCLLDEVDAPLDDANTERYANLVKKMSEQTQFLFISHNKIAMEIAHQLIGVTMQEQGVSRIVAVDIESAMQLATEAA